MIKVICIALVMLLMPSSLAQTTDANLVRSLYSTYAFTKQLYMNPLSSFLALDGFIEYYELTEHSLTIIDATGQSRIVDIIWQEEPADKKTYESSFMMEGFGIPDISIYQQRRQFALLSTDSDNIIYRLYVLDDEIWLAKIHQDTANIHKQEYIWSIYKIEKSNVIQRVSGNQEGVDDFYALLGSSKQQAYENDACYNITPVEISQTTGYQIFKFDTSCASYLLYENEIYPMGEWFGGLGVVSMAAADLNKDSLDELYFTYSFGSGLHRTHAAYFDPVSKRIVPLSPAMPSMDMMIVQNKTGELSLYEAALPFSKSFVQYMVLGTKHIANIEYLNGEFTLSPLL